MIRQPRHLGTVRPEPRVAVDYEMDLAPPDYQDLDLFDGVPIPTGDLSAEADAEAVRDLWGWDTDLQAKLWRRRQSLLFPPIPEAKSP